MKLSHELGKIFEKEMDKVIQIEIDNPGFLEQKHFTDCETRAAAGIAIAAIKATKVLALAICEHREQENQENHRAEAEQLSMALSPEEVEVGTRGWWGD